jgi:Na+-transporting methylmalonyl-CoA/oxaloacetate decarboxylase gamma subunit
MKVIIILAGVALVLAVLVLVVHAIRRNAGVPLLDDPKQVMPPPARDLSQNERHRELL